MAPRKLPRLLPPDLVELRLAEVDSVSHRVRFPGPLVPVPPRNLATSTPKPPARIGTYGRPCAVPDTGVIEAGCGLVARSALSPG